MRHLGEIGFMIFFAPALIAPAIAGPLEDGLAAYDHYDFTAALKALQPLADEGNAEAQVRLGLMYRNGWGVPVDYAQAGKWYRLAADQGNAQAQDDLGDLYAEGQGVTKDVTEAAKWEQRAADQGYIGSLSEVASMYADGMGVPQDYVRGYMWYRVAAAQGDDNADARRDLLAKKMTPDQIAEAEKLAREWKPKP
jgi:uncharacterized protein